MAYSLRRTRDGAGDSGQMSLALIPTFDHDTGKVVSVETKENARPEIGAAMRVGSHYGRSYQSQDWWQTTPITTILEGEYVRFKTGNSEYEWESF
jgi:hypothetical protein